MRFCMSRTLSSGSPQTPKPSLLQWFHIGCLKFAAERNIVPKGNAVPKQVHQERPLPLCWRGTILRFNVYWMCRACPGIPKEAPNAASALPRLGPFLFGPAVYPQRKLPVYKNEQRQRARYDRLSDGCRSRPTVSKRGRDKAASVRSPRWGHFFDASLASARYRGGWRPRGESSHSWMSICWALLRRSSRSGPGSSWDALFSRRTLSTANRSLNVRGCERERSMGSSFPVGSGGGLILGVRFQIVCPVSDRARTKVGRCT